MDVVTDVGATAAPRGVGRQWGASVRPADSVGRRRGAMVTAPTASERSEQKSDRSARSAQSEREIGTVGARDRHRWRRHPIGPISSTNRADLAVQQCRSRHPFGPISGWWGSGEEVCHSPFVSHPAPVPRNPERSRPHGWGPARFDSGRLSPGPAGSRRFPAPLFSGGAPDWR